MSADVLQDLSTKNIFTAALRVLFTTLAHSCPSGRLRLFTEDVRTSNLL